MKKKSLVMVTLLVTVCLLIGTSYGENRFFNRYAEWASDPVYEIAQLQAACTLTPGEIAASDDEIVQFIAHAWNNLYHYEIVDEKMDVEKTYAAEIYEALTEGPGLVAFTAPSENASYANVLVARNNPNFGQLYWLLWDLENQSIKVIKKYGVMHYSTDDEFLADEVFNGYLLNSVEGSPLDANTPKGSILKAYGSSSEVSKVIDITYSRMNDGEENPLKVE